MGKTLRTYLALILKGLWWMTIVLYASVDLSHPAWPLARAFLVTAILLATGLGLGIGVAPVLISLLCLFGLWALAGIRGFILPLIVLSLAANQLLGKLRKKNRTVFGRHPWFRYPVAVGITDRFLHTHVLGPTGSGKSSSVLMPMIWQDLSQGHGLSLIEPKGDLSQAARDAALRTGHEVLYMDPDDPLVPHFNPLSGPAEVAAEGLAWAMDQASQSGHPFYATLSRLELLYATLAVKEAFPLRADVATLMRFLRQEGFRREILASCQDDRTLAYYHEQVGRQSQAKAHEQRVGLLNRLELLLVNPSVRNILAGPGDFTWDEALQNGYVVICPFSLARLGGSARLLGNLFWHGLMMASYRRPVGARHPYFLFLDEFHQYVSPDLGDYLALARGYGIGITLAHQDLGQLSSELKSAALANCRQRLVLGGVSSDDERELTRSSTKPLRQSIAPDIRHLPLGKAWLERTENGRLRQPVLIQLAHRSLGSTS